MLHSCLAHAMLDACMVYACISPACNWMDAIQDTAQQFIEEDNAMRTRRQLERSTVVENDKMDHTDNWFAVERDWLEAWNDFTREGSSAPPPGPITNRLLAFADGTPRMVTKSNGGQRKLERTKDYRLVNDRNWKYLHGVYGGGPVLPRVDFERAIAAGSTRRDMGDSMAMAGSGTLSMPPPPPPGSLATKTAIGGSEELVTTHVKEGWLDKNVAGQKATGWQKRWVVLKNQKVYYRQSQVASLSQPILCAYLGSPTTAPQQRCGHCDER